MYKARSLSALLGAVGLVVPFVVVAACTTETTTTGGPSPSATTTATSTASTEPTATATTPPSSTTSDAGQDAAPPKDSGPPPTDVVGSAGCNAYCAKLKSACNVTCAKEDCAIESGQCAASTEAYLQCEADTGQFYCGTDGFSVVSGCNHDTSVCH